MCVPTATDWKPASISKTGVARSRTHQRGAALVLVLLALVIVAGLITTGVITLLNNRNISTLQLRTHGQAASVAVAGLVDTLSWFRRQGQPVREREFHPLYVWPTINDTDDESIGLVREFEISADLQLFGRYEVRRNPFPLYHPPAGEQHDYPPPSVHAARDISYIMGINPEPPDYESDPYAQDIGWAWSLHSVGYIFKKKAQNYTPADFYSVKPVPNDDPNYTPTEDDYRYKINKSAVKVLARAVVGTEIRRLVLQPPGSAAICAHRADLVYLRNRSKILGGENGAGLIYPPDTGSPHLYSGHELSGNPARQSVDPYEDDISDVFGKLEKSDIRAMADVYVTSVDDLPEQLPYFSFVYIEGNATFTSSHRLRGTGVLFVNGNLTLSDSSNSFYSGLIYVDGNYLQYAPSMVSGTIIVTGTVDIQGSGDYSEVDFDQDIIDRVRNMMGHYRFSRAFFIEE